MFNTPALLHVYMEPEEIHHEIDLAYERTAACIAWLHNQISSDDFLTILDAQGIDVAYLIAYWETLFL
jgi:hypothetical protein